MSAPTNAPGNVPGTSGTYSESALSDVMVGINGWHRWNNWAAHFFVDGKQLCHTRHMFAEGGMARGLPPVAPKPAERSSFGTLYGKTCVRCTKLKRATLSVGEADK